MINVARYYHHETVCVCGSNDDIQSNVRKGLDATKATKATKCRLPSDTNTNITLPPSKRPHLASSSRQALYYCQIGWLILCDYGKPIYKASSQVVLFAAFESCISGHESLYKAGSLHRDISIMINEDVENPLPSVFPIDLEFAIRVTQEKASDAQGRTGTRAFWLSEHF
jgi:Fungal protein kinase